MSSDITIRGVSFHPVFPPVVQGTTSLRCSREDALRLLRSQLEYDLVLGINALLSQDDVKQNDIQVIVLRLLMLDRNVSDFPEIRGKPDSPLLFQYLGEHYFRPNSEKAYEDIKQLLTLCSPVEADSFIKGLKKNQSLKPAPVEWFLEDTKFSETAFPLGVPQILLAHTNWIKC